RAHAYAADAADAGQVREAVARAAADLALYAAGKAAVAAFTRALARELGPRGITANVVHPGPIDTDMNPAGTDQAAALVQMLAVPHYGEPADIANMVAYLAGPQARYVTGAELSVDGGYAA
ncbi:SDR family oxidoreductase, partial [Bordetella pertussis]|uniref:SDR family oxidoreductase n=1 Tax=Bordetella pertussis TaxID=520 RepID=UPI000AB4BF85